ncbi:MAG TPA: TIGR00296 family protein [Thermoplasmata archaeon]|nr:TIGR00296 family protein [Thermoplasmata archaeon]
MSKFSDEEGIRAVRAARYVIESTVKCQDVPDLKLPASFKKNGGVFVTLKTHPDHELRGCIGYPEPVAALEEALVDSAISAATRDPRFSPVSADELPNLVVEVSLLTPPELIEASSGKELIGKVKIGEDGLIVERGLARGLLLPQVPIELGWKAEKFLEQTCGKAGLPLAVWKDPKTRFFKFQAEVFSEEKPHGKIKREILNGEVGCSR